MNILYLGQDNEVANTLENISPSLLIVDSPIRLLKMKTALAKIDLVVADKFQKGIAAGQFVAWYQKNELLGSGVISA